MEDAKTVPWRPMVNLENPDEDTPQQLAYDSKADRLFLGGAAGGGKALSVDEKVLTPHGFRRMGDLRVGDTICAADGAPTRVIGVYPQGIKPLYRVRFHDNCSVLADADHRWKYRVATDTEWGITTTLKLRRRLEWTLVIPLFLQPDNERLIDSIEYEQDGEAVCIAIGHPDGLFVVGEGCVVTHNSDLLLGTALTAHTRSIIFRRESRMLGRMVSRLLSIHGSRAGYSGHPEHRLVLPDNRLIRFGGVQHLGDEEAFQGQDHDLYGFDEVTQFLEQQFRYLITWNRTTKPGQRCRVIATGNPPTTPEGEWVVDYWGPWLNDQYPNPAMPGELRWFTSDEHGRDIEVDGPGPHKVPWSDEPIMALSRTFIPSSVEDNPFLMAAGYKAQLQALPEPLRSQMLRGDFKRGRDDHAWQVIPSAWVEMAQDRWTDDRPKVPMSALGVDVAQGGRDETVLQARYADWFAEPKAFPGQSTPDSPTTAGLVISALRDGAPAHIDAVGVGGEVYGHLNGQGAHVVPMYGGKPSMARALDNKIGFVNKRAEWYWRMREALDPSNGRAIALPKHPRIKSDLCAPRWSLQRGGIKVEIKEEIVKRLGRSPDYGDALVYANVPGNEAGEVKRRQRGTVIVEGIGGFDPLRY